MTEARFILTLPDLAHDAALRLAEEIEENPLLSPLAVTINETDEARGLWEVLLFFGERLEAEDAKVQMGWMQGVIAAVPEQDWVRLSLEGWHRSSRAASSCMAHMIATAGVRAGFRSRSMPAPPSAPAITAPRKAACSRLTSC